MMSTAKASLLRTVMVLVVLATALGVLASTAQPSRAADTALTCFGRQATITGSGTIIGTKGDDVIVGSFGDDTIGGLGGNDRICGLGVTTLCREDWVTTASMRVREPIARVATLAPSTPSPAPSPNEASPLTAVTICSSLARETTGRQVTTSALRRARSQATAGTTRSTAARPPTS